MNRLFPPLYALHRPAQIRLLAGLCEAIRADRDRCGADPPLLLLGAGLSYCGSLLADAGPDPAGDALHAAAASMEAEALVLFAALRAALLRPAPATWPGPGDADGDGPGADQDPEKEDPGLTAATLLATLFPGASLPGSIYEARLLLRRCAEHEPALRRLGCLPLVARIAEAAGLLERLAPPPPTSEVQARGRAVAHYGDRLIRRFVGHVVAATDPEDPRHEARARALLQPLLDLDGTSALLMRSTFGRPTT
jgi:hypothetical protein